MVIIQMLILKNVLLDIFQIVSNLYNKVLQVVNIVNQIMLNIEINKIKHYFVFPIKQIVNIEIESYLIKNNVYGVTKVIMQ